jgi:electron transfer flavoprotein beta subunit
VGLSGSYTQVMRVFAPVRRREREMLQGPVEKQVHDLWVNLKNRQLIPFDVAGSR